MYSPRLVADQVFPIRKNNIDIELEKYNTLFYVNSNFSIFGFIRGAVDCFVPVEGGIYLLGSGPGPHHSLG